MLPIDNIEDDTKTTSETSILMQDDIICTYPAVSQSSLEFISYPFVMQQLIVQQEESEQEESDQNDIVTKEIISDKNASLTEFYERMVSYYFTKSINCEIYPLKQASLQIQDLKGMVVPPLTYGQKQEGMVTPSNALIAQSKLKDEHATYILNKIAPSYHSTTPYHFSSSHYSTTPYHFASSYEKFHTGVSSQVSV